MIIKAWCENDMTWKWRIRFHVFMLALLQRLLQMIIHILKVRARFFDTYLINQLMSQKLID